MEIILKHNNSPDNKIYKVFSGENKSYEVYLLEPCDVLNPVFIVHDDLKNVSTYNYLECNDLNRKYFVTGFNSRDGERVEIQCHVDVLATYATDILNAKISALRTEKKGNKLVRDTRISNSSRATVQTHFFNNCEFLPKVSAANHCIVVTTIGGHVLGGN